MNFAAPFAPIRVTTADQMQAIENHLFAAGMPVAALMEKVAIAIAQWLQTHYPCVQMPQVGILVGPGHNGGDGLVVARELHLAGYSVRFYSPFSSRKPLTTEHYHYAQFLGIPEVQDFTALQSCDWLIDAWFGLGLTRPIVGDRATEITQMNQWPKPIVSIDLPSGIHTDTGAVLGTAIRATQTLCLGLWKRALFQDAAVNFVGDRVLIPLGIPEHAIAANLATSPAQMCWSKALAVNHLPLPRDRATHKYRQGHLLLIGGSARYAGSIILAALGARASGVGMLSIAVPESLKLLVVSQLPEALVIGCPETPNGAITALNLDLTRYDAIAFGPGLTTERGAIVEPVLRRAQPLLLDADGLNSYAQLDPTARKRDAPTILTPHPGEFARLFPDLREGDRWTAVQRAAECSGAIVLLKGAITLIAAPDGSVSAIANGTPALARGGSGDVLTGFIGGLLPQSAPEHFAATVATGAYFHAQAAQQLVTERTEMGVDPVQLAGAIAQTIAQTQTER